MASSAAADADAPIVVRVTGGTRQVDRASTPSASASSSVDRMLDASLPPTFTGGDTFRAVLDWHLRSVPGDRNLVWRIGTRVLGTDVPIDGRLADWVRVLGGSPITIAISAPGSAEHEAIKYAFACHLAGLPWPLWDADERDPINRRLLGVRSEDAAAAPRLDEDNRIGNLVGLRHGRHVKFVNVHALADAMKRGNTVEPVFRTNVADRMDDFVRCIQAAVYDSIHPYADDPVAGLLPIIELATMVVDWRYGQSFAANARRAAAASALSVPAPAATRAPTLSPAAQQREAEDKVRKNAAAAAASSPPPRQPDEEKQRADVLAKFTSQVQAYLRTTPDVTLSQAFHYYAENNSLEWDPLSIDEREKLVRAEFNLFMEEKKRKEAVLVKLAAEVRAYMRNNPSASMMRVQHDAREARLFRVADAAKLIPSPDLEKLVYDEFTRHTEERRVSAILGVNIGAGAGVKAASAAAAAAEAPVPRALPRPPHVLSADDEAQLAGAVSAAAAAAAGPSPYIHPTRDDDVRISDQIQQQKSAAAAALSESKKKKKTVAAGDAAGNSPADLAKIKEVVDAMESEARRVGRYEDGNSADHMKAVKKAAVTMLGNAGLRTTEAKRELRLRLDRIQEDAAWQARMANMQAREAWEGGGGGDRHAAAIAAEAARVAAARAPAAAAAAAGNSPDDLAKIQQIVDAMESSAKMQLARGIAGAHMETVKKTAVNRLGQLGLHTPEAKRELRLRLDRLYAKEVTAAAAAAAAAAPAPAAAAVAISADERRGIEYDIRSFDELLQGAPKTTLIEAEQANLFYRRALSADAKKEQMRQALASYRRHVQSPAAAGNPRRSIVVLFRAAQKKAPDESSAYWSRESELMIELGRSPPVEQRAYKRMLGVVQEIELRVRIGEVDAHKARAAIANAVLVDHSDKAVGVAGNGTQATVDDLLAEDHDAIIRRIADEVTPNIKRAMYTVDGLGVVQKQAIESLKLAGVHTPDATRKLKERLRKIHHQLARGDKVLQLDGIPDVPVSSSAAAAAVAVAMDADDDDHDDDDDDALSARLAEAKMRKKLDKIRAGGQQVTVFDINGPVHALLLREGVTDKAVVDGLISRLTNEYVGRIAPPAAAAAASSATATLARVEAEMRKRLDKMKDVDVHTMRFNVGSMTRAMLHREGVPASKAADALVSRLTDEYVGRVAAAAAAAPPAAAAAAASSAAANHLASRMQQLRW